jgi:hypothetical protein
MHEAAVCYQVPEWRENCTHGGLPILEHYGDMTTNVSTVRQWNRHVSDGGSGFEEHTKVKSSLGCGNSAKIINLLKKTMHYYPGTVCKSQNNI